MLKTNKKGQSTLEYVILVTAVIAVIITMLVNSNSPFRTTLNTTLNTTIDKMQTMSDRWDGSMDAVARPAEATP